MRPGIWNIIIGGLLIAGGASGKFALIGTSSTTALAVVGAVIAAFGVFQLVRSTRQK